MELPDGIDPGPLASSPEETHAILDPSQLPTPISVGVKSDTALASLKEACLHGRDSVYIMGKVVLGYDKFNERVHLPMARFSYQTRSAGGRRMMLMPRGHYKTSLWTIVDTIQEICLDPNLQFLIVADTGTNAAQFMREIQLHFEQNELFRTLFYDIVPDNFNTVIWNQYQMQVKRSAISRGPTIDAIGALGGSESRHYHRIKADDLVTEKCIRSDVEMDKVNKWAGGLESLLISINDDRIDYVGSRKKRGDLYEVQMKYYGDGYVEKEIGPYATQKGPLILFSRQAEENSEPILPEVLSKAFLTRLRKYDPERYHAQYGNSPKAEGINTFDTKGLRYFKWSPEGNIVIVEDGDIVEEISPWSMERICLYDPSVAEKKSNSKHAFHVVAKGKGPRRFILHSRIGHFSPTDAVDHLFDIEKKWRPAFYSIEKRGYQGSIKYWLAERAEYENLPYLQIEEWPPVGHPSAQWAKPEHIKALQPLVRSNNIWLHEDNTELYEEFEFYPNVRWDDGLDALSQGLTYWPASIDELDVKVARRKEREYLQTHVLGRALLPDDVDEEEDKPWDEMSFLKKLDATGYGFHRA